MQFELSKRRPHGLRFVLKERDDTTFSEQLAFPLQKPSVNIAFEEFLLRLARGTDYHGEMKLRPFCGLNLVWSSSLKLLIL